MPCERPGVFLYAVCCAFGELECVLNASICYQLGVFVLCD